MVQRPPFDRDGSSPPPGGFDPRYSDRPPLRDYDAPRGDERYAPGSGDRYERERDLRQDRPDPFDRRQAPPPAARGPGASRANRLLLILGGLLLLGAILFGLSLTRSGPGSDALDGAGGNSAEEEAAADPADRCAAPATYDLLKRELFRQAAATRGSDQQAFDQLSGYSSLRVSKPVVREQDEGLERVSCGADVALDLPPGVEVVGGRRTLTATVTYDLQPSADSSGDVLTLRGAEGIIVPLATLARTGSGAAPPPEVGEPEQADSEAAGDLPAPAAPLPAAPVPAPPPVARPPEPASPPASASARPSFSCARARTRGEIAVCNSAELAALDREMARFFTSARSEADADTRTLLDRTRTRFLAFRDRCRTDACVADAYRGRISEIRDIVDGRWRGE